MSNTEWLNRVEVIPTRQGGRLDLRIYVYPDGHGNIFVLPETTEGGLANNVEDAVGLFRQLWERAAAAHGPDSATTH